MKLRIPYKFKPRGYQLPVFKAMDEGYRRGVCIWHRRAGKDKSFFNLMVKESARRKGNYYYIFPTYSQGRKVLWDGRDKSGMAFLDHIPPGGVLKKNEAEMKITLAWGSIIQIAGSDNVDTLMGTNPCGIVFSEYALQEPKGWNYMRPILAENDGWALFNSTPRGRNHFFDLYQTALGDDRWFTQILTVDDTGAIKLEDIDAERRAGMPEELVQQEFWCSFSAGASFSVIPLEWVLMAGKREVEPRGDLVAGLDVARYGADRTAIVVRSDNAVVYVDSWTGLDTVVSAGKVLDAWRSVGFNRLYVDTIGVGGGPADVLRAGNNFQVIDVNVGEATSNPDVYLRMRDELWFRCREWFSQEDVGIGDVKDKGKLTGELTNPTYTFTPTQRKKVESKDDMRERSGCSPDLADALCLTFYPHSPVLRSFGKGVFR